MINIDAFKEVEMIVGEIKGVQDHPNADRLYILQVFNGQEEKQLVAGIRGSYEKESLIGRKVIVLNNLEPATIRGEQSQGMVLAVSDESGISLLGPDRDIPCGTRVR